MIYAFLIIVSFLIGKNFSVRKHNCEIFLLIDMMIKIDKKLSLRGKNIKDLNINELISEINNQLKLELY